MKLFLNIDMIVQVLMITLVVFSCFFLFPLIITLPLLGAWQMISAAVIFSQLKDDKRGFYLIACIVMLFIMMLCIILELVFVVGGIFFIIIPIGMAIWYFRLTTQTQKELDNKNEINNKRKITRIDSEDVLDDDLLWV